MRSVLRWVRAAVAFFVLIVVGYGAAGMAGGAIPANLGWTQPAQGIRILVESNGVHTDLVLPKLAAGVDWRDLFRPEDLADPRYARFDHVAIGWGERTFYVETPTWADVRPLTVLRAALGSDRTVLHVEHVPVPNVAEYVRAITLTPDQYRRLAAFVRASFAPRPAWHRTGYTTNDAFYAAVGRYSAVETCNSWTGDALRAAGVRVGAWTPFPVTVLGWFPA